MDQNIDHIFYHNKVLCARSIDSMPLSFLGLINYIVIFICQKTDWTLFACIRFPKLQSRKTKKEWSGEVKWDIGLLSNYFV